VVEVVEETPRVKNIALDLPDWHSHRPGQHVDVRLTAEDGYQTERSYSISSGPDDEHVVLSVERLEGGEVSPYLVDELRPGDTLELRGPVGGYFVWEASLGGPLLLVAGGSGVAPFRSVLRHHRAIGSSVPVRLLYSARALEDVLYRDELQQLATRDEVDVFLTLTRSLPEGWRGYSGRIDRELLADVSWPAREHPLVYVCGPTAFAEVTSAALVANGHDPGRIRIERFGGTGSDLMTAPVLRGGRR
jgi:ferredoxin-NADP reductase